MSELEVWCVSKLVAMLESVRSAYTLMANSSYHVLAVAEAGDFGKAQSTQF